MSTPQVNLPQICQKHHKLLVMQAGYSEHDAWRALVIASNIALFKAMTLDPKVHAKINGQIERIGSLGCFACYKPDAFGQIVEAAKTHDLGEIKRLIEHWVESARKAVP